MFNFLQNLSMTEVLIIVALLVVFFGGKKVKELSFGLGQSTKELKKVKQELDDTVSGDYSKPAKTKKGVED